MDIDPSVEQTQEIEALTAIYCDDFEIHKGTWGNHAFSIKVYPRPNVTKKVPPKYSPQVRNEPKKPSFFPVVQAVVQVEA